MTAINPSIRITPSMSTAVTALSMEQQMLLRTLAEKQRPMSVFELTNHWTPTWSLQEVQKFMQELVQLGWVQADGRESKVFYFIDRATTSGRKP